MATDRDYVCCECIGDDEGLLSFATKHIGDGLDCSDECDYCSTSCDAINVQELIAYIEECIRREWHDPANEVPWNGREGGYLWPVYEWVDVLETVGFSTNNETLYEDICLARTSCWSKIDYLAPSQSEQIMLGWNTFKQTVKHLRRYTFWTDNRAAGTEPYEFGPSPSKMLETIGQVIDVHNLLQTLPVSTRIWRLREHSSDEKIKLASELTPPPRTYALQANRMSPAGVPMFYGADDWDTAFEEVSTQDSNRRVTGGAFETLEPLTILDLSQIPLGPSYFVSDGPDRIHELQFLRQFVKDVSQLIEHDEKYHIEYVPTQVFTEFIRFELRKSLGQDIHGMCYPSSKRANKRCYALFFEQADCLTSEESKQYLRLDLNSLDTRPSQP